MTGWQDDRMTGRQEGIWQDERQTEDPRWIYDRLLYMSKSMEVLLGKTVSERKRVFYSTFLVFKGWVLTASCRLWWTKNALTLASCTSDLPLGKSVPVEAFFMDSLRFVCISPSAYTFPINDPRKFHNHLKMIIPVGITYTSALCHTVLGNYLTVPAVRTAG